MNAVEVLYQSTGWITHHGDPNDRWDRDSTDGDVHPTGLKKVKVKDKYSGHLYPPFELNHDEPYHLVTVVYTTGDSFGRDGGQAEFVELYKTRSKAFELKAKIEAEDYKSDVNAGHTGSDRFTLKYKNESDQDVQTGKPWYGYFESIDEVKVTTLYLE